MTIREFHAWQWSDYPAKHRHRVNLGIHIAQWSNPGREISSR